MATTIRRRRHRRANYVHVLDLVEGHVGALRADVGQPGVHASVWGLKATKKAAVSTCGFGGRDLSAPVPPRLWRFAVRRWPT